MTQFLQEQIDPVNLCLKLEVGTSAATWFLLLMVDAWAAVSSTPRISRLGTITLDLAGFTRFTSVVKLVRHVRSVKPQ
jgi:hypothetical protein